MGRCLAPASRGGTGVRLRALAPPGGHAARPRTQGDPRHRRRVVAGHRRPDRSRRRPHPHRRLQDEPLPSQPEERRRLRSNSGSTCWRRPPTPTSPPTGNPGCRGAVDGGDAAMSSRSRSSSSIPTNLGRRRGAPDGGGRRHRRRAMGARPPTSHATGAPVQLVCPAWPQGAKAYQS